MPGVYISHSVSPWELAQVYVLAKETIRLGLDAFIPHRNWQPSMGLPADLAGKLQQAEVILVFATANGNYSDWVNRELRAVPLQGKRIVALKERGVVIAGVPPQDIVEFDRSDDMYQVIQKVTEHLQGLPLRGQASNLLTGLVIGGLILLLLRGLDGGGDQR
jgi:hypothetical protein